MGKIQTFCRHKEDSRRSYIIFLLRYKRNLYSVHSFQSNLLLACIFCKFLKIRNINMAIFDFLSKISRPNNMSPFEKGNRRGQHPQTAWVCGLRNHNEGAKFSPGAGPWPSQWNADSTEAARLPEPFPAPSKSGFLLSPRSASLSLFTLSLKKCLPFLVQSQKVAFSLKKHSIRKI